MFAISYANPLRMCCLERSQIRRRQIAFLENQVHSTIACPATGVVHVLQAAVMSKPSQSRKSTFVPEFQFPRLLHQLDRILPPMCAVPKLINHRPMSSGVIIRELDLDCQ